MLTIEGLHVETHGKEILHGVNLHVEAGETHALFGPNGSGKTTLLMAIMGFPRYRITQGRIMFKGQDITHASLDERARLGIGMSFQRPPVVRGVKTRDMVRACLGGREDDEMVATLAEQTEHGRPHGPRDQLRLLRRRDQAVGAAAAAGPAAGPGAAG